MEKIRKHFRWYLPIGVLIVLVSIFLPADPGAGIEAIPFGNVAFFLGISLSFLFVLSLIWPRRILFILDGILFSLITLYVALDVFFEFNLLSAVAIIFLASAAYNGFTEYFRNASIPTQDE